MTIARIEHVAGGRDTENIILLCTGCDETFNYSVRQYKGDFGCNITEFNQFLTWAKWEAAKHECFAAGRGVYMTDEPPSELERHASKPEEELPRGFYFEPNCITCGKPSELFVDGDCPQCNPPIVDDPLAYHVDFPQAERHEDPWGGVGYIVEPEDDPMDDGDWDDELDAWMDEELDLPPRPLDLAKTLDFRRLYEMGPTDYRYGALSADEAQAILLGYVYDDDSDNYDWEENRFDFLYGEPTMLKTYSIFEIREMPRKFEGEMVYIEFDYAETEQRVVDEELLRAGIYSLDDHGCLRDEKNRCLACLRPGPHFPFYYGRD